MRAEKTTLVSLPKRATESIFPLSAIKVMAIMRIDHCSGSEISKLSSSKNALGATSKKIALRPNTVDPNFRIVRRRLIVRADFNAMAKY
jgi:hypothetical protein